MLIRTITAAALLIAAAPAAAQPLPPHVFPPRVAAPATHDGAHDFDFLLGDWKAHVKRLPDRLVGSSAWVEYDGTDSHHSVLGSAANFEEFEVDSPNAPPGAIKHIHAQTLRLYNPTSRQWSIYGFDLAAGTMDLPAVVGAFHDGLGEFYNQQDWKGRMVLVRYQWGHKGPDDAHMEQAFSLDGGKTWEVNWICDLVRAKPR
ncbi:hypothetical protein [Phenylobacterium sp.]|jgi:hypothetical protein|uniref:hypothetical protein n=1 Tax=Phenylobacterium sp. TaxID=1871053 RepID=UPI002F402B1E